jgi:hypothetical protein
MFEDVGYGIVNRSGFEGGREVLAETHLLDNIVAYIFEIKCVSGCQSDC